MSATDYRLLARQVAERHGLNPDLFEAQIRQESGFNPKIVSPAGAIGLGQLMPGTAAELGVKNPYDPVENLNGAARYMQRQLKDFNNDYSLALAAYNAGPGAVQKARGIPAYRETQNYVRTIMQNAGQLGRTRGAGASMVAPSETAVAPVSPEPAEPVNRKPLPALGASTIADAIEAPTNAVKPFERVISALSQAAGTGDFGTALRAALPELSGHAAQAQMVRQNQELAEALFGAPPAARTPAVNGIRPVERTVTGGDLVGVGRPAPEQVATQLPGLDGSTGTSAPQGLITGRNKGIIITSAADASGEPGSDFVIEGGKRGANFYFPYPAKVHKVVADQNWRTDLTTNPGGRRGYGNYVDLTVTLPSGRVADVRAAHLDSVNPHLRPGAVLPGGALIGTQGDTGSATAPHVSVDWYKPHGSYTPDLAARDEFLNSYLKATKG